MTGTGFMIRAFGLLSGAVLLSTAAIAQQPGPTTSAGPGRIICKNAASCELGLGTPPKLKYTINATALSDADKERLTKTCSAAQKAPCIATVQGTEMGDAMKIKAAKITFYN